MQLTAEQDSSVRVAMQRVHRSVARFSRNDAQDFVQEAAARAVRAGVECDAEPWLKVVARRIATDHARRDREVASDPVTMERSTRARAASPEEIVVAADSASVIQRAIHALPVRYRDALLTYAQEQDHAAVARSFGISANATWSLLCRARARLRQELDRVGYAFGVVTVRVQRWVGDVSTAAAVTCVAVGATFVAPATASVAAPVVERSKAAVTVSIPSVTPEAAHTSVTVEPGPVAKVVKVVKETVHKKKEIATYAVRPCGPTGAPLPLGVEVMVLNDARRSIVGGAIAKLPAPLRKLDVLSC